MEDLVNRVTLTNSIFAQFGWAFGWAFGVVIWVAGVTYTEDLWVLKLCFTGET